MIDNIKKWNAQISNDIEDLKQGMKDIGKVTKGIWKVYEFTYDKSIGIYINKKLEEHYKLKEQEIKDKREKINKFMYHRLNETVYMQRQLLDKNAERPNFKLEQSRDAYEELKDNQKILNKLHKNPYRTNSLEKYMDDNYMKYLKNEKMLEKAGKFQKNKFSKSITNEESDLHTQHEKQKLIRETRRRIKAETKNLDEAVKSPMTLVMTGGLSMFAAALKDMYIQYEGFKDLKAELKEIQERKDLKDNEMSDRLFKMMDNKLSKEIKDLYKSSDEKTLKEVLEVDPKEIIKGEVVKNSPEKQEDNVLSKSKQIATLVTGMAIVKVRQELKEPKFIDIEKLDSFKQLENNNKKLDKFIDTSLLENKQKPNKTITYNPEVKDSNLLENKEVQTPRQQMRKKK